MTGSICEKNFKSGNSYLYIVLHYKDARSGKWRNKMVSTGLPAAGNKRKAKAMIYPVIEKYAYLEEIPAELSAVLNPEIRICEYLDYWLAGKERDLKGVTFENYTSYVGRIKEYFAGNNPKMADVTAKTADQFFKYALSYGKINQKTHANEPLSVRTVRSYKNILSAAFDQAAIDGLVKVNPVRNVVVHGRQNCKYSEEMLFLTEDEISDFLHFLSARYPRLLGIAFMAAYYGLRRSEILGLRWSDIDYDKQLVRIQRTVVRSKTVFVSDETKTQAGRRDLNLFPTAEKCLRRIMAAQADDLAFYGSAYRNMDGYVFCWEDGRMYDPGYVSRAFVKATKAYGRPEITLHKLRHSCASMLINRGWDVKRLQYWLGHTDTQTTLNIYAHFDKGRMNANDNDLVRISQAADDLFS